MNGEQARPSTWKSVWAVLAGFIVIVVTSTAVDAVLHVAGIFPPMGQAMSNGFFVLATAYRIVFGILGCYVTARLAPDRPLTHALWLGYVGVVISAVATVITWNKGPEFGPHWYPIALVLISIPCAWLGGKLYERQRLSTTG